MVIKRIRDNITRLLKIPARIVEKRVPFNYGDVVSGWNITDAALPHYCARLYNEVKLLNEAIGGYHAEKSLEIGCGYGRLTPWIAEHSDQHYAIEPEGKLFRDAKKLYSRMVFKQEKVQNMQFDDFEFDLCVSWTVLQHIPPQYLRKAISEIKRVSKPNSIIILSEGIGNNNDHGYWEREIEEYKTLLSPWKLNWYKERKLDNNVSRGLVMRFIK